jgi:large conductance mechanosensitive channel
MGVWDDFKKFLLSGNLVTMAVAFVVGLAIVAVITAIVTDIIDPLISAAFSVNFASLGVVTVNGSHILFGALMGAIITFLILMVVVFFLIAYPYQKVQERKAAKTAVTTRDCPFCCTTINLKATKCASCGSDVPPAPPAT